MYNSSKEFANEFDEFKNDCEVDPYGPDPVGSNPDGFDPNFSFLDNDFKDRRDNGDDLNDYEYGDDREDKSAGDVVKNQACIKCEENPCGFEIRYVGDELMLRPR